MDKRIRAIEIEYRGNALKEYGLWKVFWGADIFINGVPFLKSLVLANIIVWVLLYII